MPPHRWLLRLFLSCAGDASRWASSTDVSHQTLTQVMRALVDAAILTENELLPPSALVSALSRDADPDANAV